MSSPFSNKRAGCYVYAYFDTDGSPAYVGEGCGKRFEDHLKVAPKGEGRFYSWLRYMEAHRLPIRREILYPELDKWMGFDVERALLSELGRYGQGGHLLNRNGYGCETPAGRADIRRDHKWHRRKWHIPALFPLRVSKAAKDAYRLCRYEACLPATPNGFNLLVYVKTADRLYGLIADDGSETYSDVVLRLAAEAEAEKLAA